MYAQTREGTECDGMLYDLRLGTDMNASGDPAATLPLRCRLHNKNVFVCVVRWPLTISCILRNPWRNHDVVRHVKPRSVRASHLIPEAP